MYGMNNVRKKITSLSLIAVLAFSILTVMPLVPAHAITALDISPSQNRASDDREQEAKYTIKFTPGIKFAVKTIRIEFPDGFDISGAKLADVTNIPRTARIFYPTSEVADPLVPLPIDNIKAIPDPLTFLPFDGDPKSIMVVLAKPTILRTDRLITINLAGIINEDIRPFNEKIYDDCASAPPIAHTKAKVPHTTTFNCFTVTTFDRFLAPIETKELITANGLTPVKLAYPNVIAGQIQPGQDPEILESASSPVSPPEITYDLTIDKTRILTQALIGPRDVPRGAEDNCSGDGIADIVAGTPGCLLIDGDEIEARGLGNADPVGVGIGDPAAKGFALTIETLRGKMLIQAAEGTMLIKTDTATAIPKPITFEIEASGGFVAKEAFPAVPTVAPFIANIPTDDNPGTKALYTFQRLAGSTTPLVKIFDDGDVEITDDLTIGDSATGGDLLVGGRSTLEHGYSAPFASSVGSLTTIGQPAVLAVSGIDIVPVLGSVMTVSGISVVPVLGSIMSVGGLTSLSAGSIMSVGGVAATALLEVGSFTSVAPFGISVVHPVAINTVGINLFTGATTVTGSLHVTGALTVLGVKLAVVDTSAGDNKGLFARESPEVKFIDEGVTTCTPILPATTCSSVIVPVDPEFRSVIVGNSVKPWIIQLTPYFSGSLYVSSITDPFPFASSFTVTPVTGTIPSGAKFTWSLSAFRSGSAEVDDTAGADEFKDLRFPTMPEPPEPADFEGTVDICAEIDAMSEPTKSVAKTAYNDANDPDCPVI